MENKTRYSEETISLFNRMIDEGWSSYDIEEFMVNEAIDCFKNEIYVKKYLDNIIHEDKEEILNSVIENSNGFFNDKVNIIYLKLFSLYNLYHKIKGENIDLYYFLDRFSPNEKESSDVVKTMQNVINSYLNEETLVDETTNYTIEIINKMKKVKEYANSVVLPAEKDEDKRLEITDMLSEVSDSLKYYDATSLAETAYESCEYEIAIPKIEIANVASLYCDVYGKNLTDEEKQVIKYEFSEEEIKSLNTVLNGTKKH